MLYFLILYIKKIKQVRITNWLQKRQCVGRMSAQEYRGSVLMNLYGKDWDFLNNK